LEARGWEGEGDSVGKGRGRRKGGVMTQSLYAHMNKGNKKQTNEQTKKNPKTVLKRFPSD
jgi:hypothetical protein